MSKKFIFVVFFLLLNSVSYSQSWQQLNGPFGGTFRDVKRCNDGSILLLVDGGLYCSKDNAQSWKKVEINNYFPLTATRLFIHPSGRIFLSSNNGFYRSDSTGLNWEDIYYMNGAPIAIDKKGNLYFTTYGGGIKISRDLGKSFEDFKYTSGFVSDFLQIDDNSFMVPNDKGVSLTSDGGNTWLSTSIPIRGNDSILLLKIDSKKNLYVGTNNELFISSDMAKTWNKIKFPVEYAWTLNISSTDEIFVCAPFDYQYYLFSSKDHGKTWERTINDYMLFAIEDTSGDIYAGSFKKLYLRKKNSKDWNDISPSINNKRISSVVAKSNDVYVTSIEQFYHSSDGGNTWVQPSQPSSGVFNLAAIDSKGRLWANLDGNISYSTDKGITWTNCKSNSSTSYNEVTINVTKDDVVYAATKDGNIYSSKDLGKSWNLIFKDSSEYWNPLLALSNSNELYFSFGRTLRKYSPINNSIEILGYFENGIGKIAVSPLNTIYVLSSYKILFMYGIKQWMELQSKNGYESPAKLFITDKNLMIIYENGNLRMSSDLGNSFVLFSRPNISTMPISLTFDDNNNYYLGTQENGLFKLTTWEFTKYLPAKLSFLQNYPNPFNNQTSIQFTLPSSQNVSLKVYDILGREVETIINSSLPVGYYKFDWRPKDVASGVYIYQLRADSFVDTKKMVFMK